MQRIPPNEQIRKQLDDLLSNGLGGHENVIGTLVQLEAQLVVHELLEWETTQQLGRAHYQHRRPGELLCGYRKGYEPGCLARQKAGARCKCPKCETGSATSRIVRA